MKQSAGLPAAVALSDHNSISQAVANIQTPSIGVAQNGLVRQDHTATDYIDPSL
jgi:hypothetical protein